MQFKAESTPARPPEFFAWMARQLLDSAHSGSSWMVAGFPGPVTGNGEIIGPMANVKGMDEKTYNLRAELVAADSDVENALDQGYKLLAVNDGTLAAHAAASRIGEYKYDKAAALIFGTGVGAGVVVRDPAAGITNLYHADGIPLEIGHITMSEDPYDRFEDAYCGPGLEKRYGMPAHELPDGHPAWRRQGAAIARLSMLLGLINGVELVVPTGGVGVGASDKFGPFVWEHMITYRQYGNGAQQKFAPDIRFVPPKMSQEFEMYGAEGVMLDHVTSSNFITKH
jgi:hypothetical protein